MKKFVCIFLLILTTVVALAVPARRGVTKTLKLTDGTMVTAQLVGDEHGHYWLTGDGRAYQRLTGLERYQQVDAEQVT